jgi:ferredoxin
MDVTLKTCRHDTLKPFMKCRVCLLLLSVLFFIPVSLAFGPNLKATSNSPPYLVRSVQSTCRSNQVSDTESVDQKLLRVAQALKLEKVDPKKDTYKLASKDPRYGLEVIRTDLQTEPSLGLELTEMTSIDGGLGLVLVSGMSGNCATTPIQVGDVVARVSGGKDFKESTVGLDYDGTVEVLLNAKQAAANREDNGRICLELERIVERALIQIQVQIGEEVGEGGSIMLECRAGENLRGLLLRRGIKLGDCAGQGQCGMCTVSVREGQELLSAKEDPEVLLTKGRPVNWRASCRTVVGASNQPGRVCIRTTPYSA